MIRLMILLCIGIYATLMILGEDRGQKRYGLMMADQLAAEAAAAAPEVPAQAEAKSVFIPAQPVMRPIDVAVRTAIAADPAPAEPVAALPEPALPEPEIAGGTLFTVAASGANVRQGPGTSFAVLDSLRSGEQVLVVKEAQVIDGWSKVRLEGDGVEGYIATRLLTQSE